MSVAYNYMQESVGDGVISPSLDIEGCTFINNSAVISDNDTYNVTFALTSNKFFGRGGAISIVPQGAFSNVQVGIRNTTFLHNKAEAGGAVSIVVTGYDTRHDFSFECCNFTANTANYGGGLHVVFLLQNLKRSRLMIFHSYLKGNSAKYGGGISVVEVSCYFCILHDLLHLQLFFFVLKLKGFQPK